MFDLVHNRIITLSLAIAIIVEFCVRCVLVGKITNNLDISVITVV